LSHKSDARQPKLLEEMEHPGALAQAAASLMVPFAKFHNRHPPVTVLL
jgi:hypothetical protein